MSSCGQALPSTCFRCWVDLLQELSIFCKKSLQLPWPGLEHLIKDAFHHAKVFWKFQSEFKWIGPDSILVSSEWNIWNHLWRWSAYFGHNIPNEIRCSFFDKLVFALIWEFRKGIKHGKNHSYSLARFNWKILFHFPRVFPLVSDQLVWKDGKHP